MKKPLDTPIYIQIAESVRRQILSGDRAPGERIAPIREVAEAWNCTPGTVNRAYQLLASEGLVVGRPGKGTVVVEGTSTAPQPVWGWASLVNRAETFLLETIYEGYSLPEGEAAVSLAASNLRERLKKEPQPKVQEPHSKAGLRFGGSHDLLIGILARFLRESDPAYPLDVKFTGSLGGLFALSRGEIDLCGIHLWDSTTDTYNLPFVEHVLPNRKVLLLTLAHRRLGLIVPTGNPDGVTGLSDIANPHHKFVNRQRGSGTRVWLDGQLLAGGIAPSDIPGYEQVVTTHTAVADAVAGGEASGGLGIQAAVNSLGLDFVPLTLERYEIVIPEELTHQNRIRTVIEVVRSQKFRETLRILGGYDDRQTGTMRKLP